MWLDLIFFVNIVAYFNNLSSILYNFLYKFLKRIFLSVRLSDFVDNRSRLIYNEYIRIGNRLRSALRRSSARRTARTSFYEEDRRGRNQKFKTLQQAGFDCLFARRSIDLRSFFML